MSKQTDNHNPAAKLALRRHFLRRYHADGRAQVLDCCQAAGRLWNTLRREFACASYWGVDLKPKKGRLKVDSVRILDQPGWPQDVVDIDTYGSPWKHWTALLRHAPDAVTVFLTIGMVKAGGGNYDRAILPALGVDFQRLELPRALGVKLGELGVERCIAKARDHGFEIIECQEAPNTSPTARYIGVRLERRSASACAAEN